jgi:hypothetical protein
MAYVEPYRGILTSQEADQFFNQPQGGFGEWLGVEFMPQVRRCIRTQSNVFAFLRLIAQ